MSSRKLLDGDHNNQPSKSGVVINGPRPAPLKVKQESHTIHKQRRHDHKQMIRPPIIIYTRSPEVIHTKPHEFMALVQKLTGHPAPAGSRDHQDEQQQKKTLIKQLHECNRNNSKELVFSNNDSNSVTHVAKDKIMKAANKMMSSPMFNPPSNPCMNDIPLFTPNAISDYFCSPRRFYGVSDLVSSSPNLMNASSSPAGGSILEIFKGLPEY